jgi:hypothetical protein
MSNNNYNFLRSLGIPLNSVGSFSRVRSVGDKKTAITHDGEKVERAEFIWCDGYGLVECVPYELHFIYEDPRSKDSHPKKIKGRWAHMCTCGSPAVVASYNETKALMTPKTRGYLLMCAAHTSSKQTTGIGTHADGSHE